MLYESGPKHSEVSTRFLNLIRTTERRGLGIPVVSVTRWETQSSETLPITMSATVKKSAARPLARTGRRARLESPQPALWRGWQLPTRPVASGGGGGPRRPPGGTPPPPGPRKGPKGGPPPPPPPPPATAPD